jgi:[acyl-carrier-protein] S-malonyltransferase
VPEPHPDIGDWWTLYDYGPEAVRKWAKECVPEHAQRIAAQRADHALLRSYKHPYPEEVCRDKEEAKMKAEKAARRERRSAALYGTGVRCLVLLLALPGVLLTRCSQVMALPTSAAAPATPVAFLFPGQGSQAVGMLKSCQDLPAVAAMLDTAKRVLGYDLLAICTDGALRCKSVISPGRASDDNNATGPKSKLDETEYAQPALFVAGLAAVEKLRSQDARAADSASACAGLSLGEYTALVHAGALSFEDGLKVVKVRAESMAAAAAAGQPHGMLSVIGLADADLKKICDAAAAAAGPGCAPFARHRVTQATSANRACCAVRCAAWPTTCSRRGAWCLATRLCWRMCWPKPPPPARCRPRCWPSAARSTPAAWRPPPRRSRLCWLR